MDATARRTLRAVTRELRRLLEGADYRQGVACSPTEAAFLWTFRLLLLRSLQVRKLTSSLVGFAAIEDAQLADAIVRACLPDADWFPEFLATPLPTPSAEVLRRCVNLVWGHEAARGQQPATAAMLTPPAALSWAYQFWKAEDKKDVLERIRTRKSLKVEGDDVISATSLYTEAYMARFLVQHGLGCLPRRPTTKIDLLDLACGAGHLLLEAFESLYDMYLAEKIVKNPVDICTGIFRGNLHGIDIDLRGILVARVVLALRAAEKAPGFRDQPMKVAPIARRLPVEVDHVSAFLEQCFYAESYREPLATVFRHLQHADEIGSLVRIEEPLKQETGRQTVSGLILEFIALYFAEVGKSRENTLLAEPSARFLFAGLALLAERYDVVLANPPYLGPKRMGQVLRRHLAECYPDTREDLQTAFLQRCFELTRDGGVTATVTVKSWLYQASFRTFRREVLSKYTLSVFADLGSDAFHADQGLHHGVSVILTCFVKQPSAATHMVGGVRATTGKGPEEKEQLMQAALADAKSPRRFNFPQSRLLTLPDAPFCYWLPASILDALKNGPTLVGRVKQGLATTDNNRFLRFAWEVPHHDKLTRWFPCEKGGTHSKWAGPNEVRVNWENDGAAIKDAILTKYPYLSGWQWVAKNSDYYLKPGLTYSYMGYGSLSARVMKNAIFEVASIGVFPDPEQMYFVLAVLNSRTASWILRALCQKHMFQAGITEKLPLPAVTPKERERVDFLVKQCIHLKYKLLHVDQCQLRPASFYDPTQWHTVSEFLGEIRNAYEKDAAALLATECELEWRVRWPLTNAEECRRDEEMGPLQVAIPPSVTDLLKNFLCLEVDWFFRSARRNQEGVTKLGLQPLGEHDGLSTLSQDIQNTFLRIVPGKREEIEREFEVMLGTSLAEWLRTRFFRHFLRWYKRRPPVWHLRSKPVRRGRRPAFACLVYYEYLTSDTLRVLCEELVAPHRATQEGEAAEELDEFTRALLRVEKEGFYSPEVWTRTHAEPLDDWCSPDGIAPPPRDHDAFIKQEARYVPDLNDGVRVNLAPLQREGLLAVNVLTARDVERAIADRAAWRADERRLCREGKLPRPAWWTNV